MTVKDFNQCIDALINLKRTGWIIRDVPNPESVAAHSWRMAIMAIKKEQEIMSLGADTDKVIKICLTHDMAEAVVGDIIPERHQKQGEVISKEQKKAMEINAIKTMAINFNFPELETLFMEYENISTIEAKIAKNFDKIDMILQAYEYSIFYPNISRLNEFMQYNEHLIDLDIFKPDIAEIKHRQNGGTPNENLFVDFQMQCGWIKHSITPPCPADICFKDAITAFKQNPENNTTIRQELTKCLDKFPDKIIF